MDLLQELRDATDGLPTAQMLRYLLKERFPGEVVVTASLKAPSIVTLQMISDIDPSTPVIFCHPQQVFPESETYRAEIIGLLGLSNVKVVTRSDPPTEKRPYERCERLWSEVPGGGRIRETIHLNETLAPYKCWIKAAYHDGPAGPAGHRLDLYGGLVIVDVSHRRTIETIDRFMQAHGLPYHPKVRRRTKRVYTALPDAPVVGYHF